MGKGPDSVAHSKMPIFRARALLIVSKSYHNFCRFRKNDAVWIYVEQFLHTPRLVSVLSMCIEPNVFSLVSFVC